jgi:AbrB family looped-hinge helix DNA binding protein
MPSTLTSKGQITIPKPVRDALRLTPGAQVEFAINPQGEVVLRPAARSRRSRARDRFDAARGKATVKWRTDELMRLLRSDD